MQTHPIREDAVPDGRICVNIPAELVPVDKITFTVHDSFFNYYKTVGKREADAPNDVTAQLFNADQFRALLDAEGFPEELDKGDRRKYIECQLWTRDFEAWGTALAQLMILSPIDKTFAVPKTLEELAQAAGLIPDGFLAPQSNEEHSASYTFHNGADFWSHEESMESYLADCDWSSAGKTEAFDATIADKHFSEGTDKGLRSAANEIRKYMLPNDNIPGQSTNQRHQNRSSRRRR